jgi:hypothetical protein
VAAQQGASVYIVFDGAFRKGIDFARCSVGLDPSEIGLTVLGLALDDLVASVYRTPRKVCSQNGSRSVF